MSGIVAFRTSESKQGNQSLNGDSDTADAVLQILLRGSNDAINTGMAVTPCRLEACDPCLPYRVLEGTVKFLTFECDQGGTETRGCPGGGTDLDGDRRADHLVLQVLIVKRAMATLAQRRAQVERSGAVLSAQAEAESMAEATRVLAGASTGLCTTTGRACPSDADCGGPGGEHGTCFVPPGGCVRDLGTTCDPTVQPPKPGSCPTASSARRPESRAKAPAARSKKPAVAAPPQARSVPRTKPARRATAPSAAPARPTAARAPSAATPARASSAWSTRS